MRTGLSLVWLLVLVLVDVTLLPWVLLAPFLLVGALLVVKWDVPCKHPKRDPDPWQGRYVCREHYEEEVDLFI